MNVSEIVDKFRTQKVLIVGDVMVDAYLKGQVHRISPEAPVPVVELSSREERLGGAANVALNIKALDACPIVCTVIGADAKGEDFLRLMSQESIDSRYVMRSKDRYTTTKYRILGNQTQLLRVDQEHTHPLSGEELSSFIATLTRVFEHEAIDVVVLQDYDKGVLTPEVIQHVVSLSRAREIPVCVDPKHRNFWAYDHVTLFKPNLKEMREGMGLSLKPTDDTAMAEAMSALRHKMHVKITFLTLSEHGVVIAEDGQYHRIAAHHRDISDVSGAGDTVISVAALGLAIGMPLKSIAMASNLAGGLVCEQVGVVALESQRFFQELSNLQSL